MPTFTRDLTNVQPVARWLGHAFETVTVHDIAAATAGRNPLVLTALHDPTVTVSLRAIIIEPPNGADLRFVGDDCTTGQEFMGVVHGQHTVFRTST